MTSSHDQLQRFLFDHTDIRGELVQLENSYQDALNNHQYPPSVATLLGEFMAAVAMLTARLKFEGRLTLQARSEGQIPLIMAEATSQNTLRGIASQADKATSEDFQTLLTNGQLSLIIEPKEGQRYQGIVPLDGNNLAQCLEHYFAQSEQLSTRIWLSAADGIAAGILLQELPDTGVCEPSQREISWEHITTLADTLTAQELLSLPFDVLLHRLYHEEPVRVFEPSPLSFKCSCSQDRTLKALSTLSESELNDILAEQGHININCEFCHQHYQFNRHDIAQLFHPSVH